MTRTDLLPKSDVSIRVAYNGYMVHKTWPDRDDPLGQVPPPLYVFESFRSLTDWLRNNLLKPVEGPEVTDGQFQQARSVKPERGILP